MGVNVFWFRRDLRLFDNVGLFHALKAGLPVIPVFIFDTNILVQLDDRSDPRVHFIYQTILELKKVLQQLGSDLEVRYGDPTEVFLQLISEYKIESVFSNHDFEPYALKRDESVKVVLSGHNILFKTFKDHVIFEKEEITKDDGSPYTVFTPYKKKWLATLADNGQTLQQSNHLKNYASEANLQHLMKFKAKNPLLSIKEIGFEASQIVIPPNEISASIIKTYDVNRDYPAINGTSKLGLHFRFGTISIRDKAKKAISLNMTYLNELIWRDFYSMILYHFPHVVKGAFRKEYDLIQWENDETKFKAWCEGNTGYPIVDAGMRELMATGYMHNRVRMITASFLTKHLLIDWRWGEAIFAAKLLDFDLASNNGGWQWAAGCGTDAAPYFRIFSPDAQTEKFDKQRIYIKKWVPQFGGVDYPAPIVDHKLARTKCLATYKKALAK